MSIRSFSALATFAVATSLAATTSADTPPSVWDRARDPADADAYRIHEEVQKRIIRLTSEKDPLYPVVLESAKGILLASHAESSRSPLLRYDLAYVYSELKDYPRAAQIYRATIAEFPDHPATQHAWLRLAFACGHLGDNLCERECYTKTLAIETEEVLRATPILNLAETQMHLGDLKEAIELYREALRIAGRYPTRDTAPLAAWGLAIALDRSGDRVGGEREAKFALDLERSSGQPGLLHSENVFFVPKYEVHWYEGLGAIAQARAATSPRLTAAAWEQAETAFTLYIEGAEDAARLESKNKAQNPNAAASAGSSTNGDRWLPLARARLLQVKVERARAAKNAASEPPPPPPPADVHL